MTTPLINTVLQRGVDAGGPVETVFNGLIITPLSGRGLLVLFAPSILSYVIRLSGALFTPAEKLAKPVL